MIATGFSTTVAVVVAASIMSLHRTDTSTRVAAAGQILQGAQTQSGEVLAPVGVVVPVPRVIGDGWLFGGPGYTGGRVVNPPGASGLLLGGDGALSAVSGPDLAADGIPTTALRAYRLAAAREARLRPSCGLRWPLLAGIGRVESNHGRYAGAVLHIDGLSTPRIIGIPLNGVGTEVVRDTDHGRLDGDRVYDRAVGPMQFIPSTWVGFGVDANGDGKRDPNNIFDAAAAASDYLCAAGRDLSTYAGQVRAVRSYNNSDAYITMVLALERSYAGGVTTVPTAPGHGTTGPVTGAPRLPPVDPGKPRGVEPKPKPSGKPPSGKPSSGAPSSGAPSSGAPSSGAPSSGAPSEGGPSSAAPDPSTSSEPEPDPTPVESTTEPGTTGAPTSEAPTPTTCPPASDPSSDAPSTSPPSDAPTEPSSSCLSAATPPGADPSGATSDQPSGSP